MGKIFKRGLIALAPVAISIAIIIWLFDVLEKIFRVPLEWLVGKYYFPGMGLLAAAIFIFFVGIVINNYVIQKFTSWLDRVLARTPLFKIFYNSIRDMMSYFKPKEAKKKGTMVAIEIDSMRLFGVLTREDTSDLPDEIARDGDVTVFIPFSYQIGGFTVLVPRSKVKPVNMTVDQGMRFVITAGMVSSAKEEKK